ncbi:MAG: hypothetical protein BKP49_04345 [Treponema sp. CETP13]|nr:MAG: hypothetical protein BKP49_04345 [Treponema sp. CETP13]
MKDEKETLVHYEDLKLLPKTRDFFDTQTSKAIPVFIIVLFAILAGFLIWASFAKMDDTIKANAILRPVDTISSLRSLVSGEIVEKYYTQNEQVKKGHLLLKIDNVSESINLENCKIQLKKIIEEIEEENILIDSINSCQNKAEKNSNAWVKAETYLAEYNRQQNVLEQQKQAFQQEDNMPESLRIQQKIDDCKATLEQSTFSFSSWKNDHMMQATNLLNSLNKQKQSLELQIVSSQRTIKNANLYAPIDGYINEIMQLNSGDFVIAGNELLRIIPDDDKNLKVEIIVDAAHIARIKTGQEAKLRFPGLPPSTFGQLSSYITIIPADMIIVSNTPVFNVEADVPNPYLESFNGEKIHLRSGISAEARIIISHDTVLHMILRKLDFLN